MTHGLGDRRCHHRRCHLLSASSGRAADAWARGEPEAGTPNESVVSKARARVNAPRARPPQSPAALPRGALLPGWKPETLQATQARARAPVGTGRQRGHQSRGVGTVGRQAGGGAARSQQPGVGPGNPWKATAGAGGEGRYLLLDLPVLCDNPVGGGEGASSRHA